MIKRCKKNTAAFVTATAAKEDRSQDSVIRVRFYLILFILRSLQIFLARKLPISVYLGKEDLLFNLGFHHHE